MSFSLHRFLSPDALATTLAQSIADSLRAAVAARGQATLALSGGRTPGAMFDALSLKVLPWQAVDVLQVDERLVDIGHADSNAQLISSRLLRNQAAPARFHPLINAYNKLGVVSVCNEFYAIKNGALNVVQLGMGDDGHFASLFPNTPAASAALQQDFPEPYCLVQPSAAPYTRLSMSLPAILNAERIVLQITSESRLALLQAAANGGQPQLPIAKLLAASQGRLEVWWAA